MFSEFGVKVYYSLLTYIFKVLLEIPASFVAGNV